MLDFLSPDTFLTMSFERVYVVWEYYDGVRSGIAEYGGKPFHFHCEWKESEDNYAETFVLTPVDEETLSLALEQWSIWREWERKFASGEVLVSTHPDFPGQDQKFAELRTILDGRISKLPPSNKRARAKFRPLANQILKPAGTMREVEVEWTIIS